MLYSGQVYCTPYTTPIGESGIKTHCNKDEGIWSGAGTQRLKYFTGRYNKYGQVEQIDYSESPLF